MRPSGCKTVQANYVTAETPAMFGILKAGPLVKHYGGRILRLILHDEWREYQTIRVGRTKAIGATTQLELARMAFGGPPRYLAAGKMMRRLLGLFDPFLREFENSSASMSDMIRGRPSMPFLM
jgi:hypothetical protein